MVIKIQNAVVTGSTKDYLWILSRTRQMDEPLYNEMLNFCKINGFAMENLIKVKQEWKQED